MSSQKQSLSNILGHQFEGYTCSLLKHLGFDNVHVTPPTQDYGIDVIGKINFHHNFGIQCKHVMNPNRKIGYRAVEETCSGVKYYNLHRGIVFTNGNFTLHAQHGAKINHILLWDGNTQELLIRMQRAHISIYDLLDYNNMIIPFIKSLF